MSIKSVMPSNRLIHCCPLLLLPSIFPSSRVFSNESALHIKWPKFWSFSFNNSPSNEYSALISFKIAWFHFLAVQGTLKSLLQHHSWKAFLWHSAFLMVQLSHPYMTTGKGGWVQKRIKNTKRGPGLTKDISPTRSLVNERGNVFTWRVWGHE